MNQYLDRLHGLRLKKHIPEQPSKPSKPADSTDAPGFEGFEGGSSIGFSKPQETVPPQAKPVPEPAGNPDGLVGSTTGCDTWSEEEAERAAVIEFDGGAPRAWAEALARLDPAKPPSDVPARRWLLFINDCGSFLDDGWAAKADELKWSPLELFGCHATKPFARTSQAGLLWITEGRKIVELTADTASISTPNGEPLTYYRKVLEAGGIPVWELAANHTGG
jgi:hypothetical protein